MSASTITITALDGGSFSAYLARPASEPAPGVVVIQEIFGANSVMRGIADTYAQAGYIALVPDLFWRQEPGIELSDQTESDRNKAFALYADFSVDKGVDDLIATLNTLRTLPGCTGKVGSVGFCLGGRLAYLLATRSDAECNVSYYGVGIENDLNEAANIQHPLLLHIAEQDEFVPSEAQSKIKAGLNDHSGVTIHSYPGVHHAFARIGGNHYDKDATEKANNRTLDFLKEHLS